MKKNLHLRWFAIAGLCGGLAEVLWISAYSAFAGTQVALIGSAISVTVLPASAGTVIAPYLGLAIHFGLSVLLAIGFGSVIWPIIQKMFMKAGAIMASLLILALVWKVNYFLLLPVWNPEFISLLPLPVTLASKLMFGITMGVVLNSIREKEVIKYSVTDEH